MDTRTANALKALSAIGMVETPDDSEGWFCRNDAPDFTEKTFLRRMQKGIAAGTIESRKFGVRRYYRQIHETKTRKGKA